MLIQGVFFFNEICLHCDVCFSFQKLWIDHDVMEFEEFINFYIYILFFVQWYCLRVTEGEWCSWIVYWILSPSVFNVPCTHISLFIYIAFTSDTSTKADFHSEKKCVSVRTSNKPSFWLMHMLLVSKKTTAEKWAHLCCEWKWTLR